MIDPGNNAVLDGMERLSIGLPTGRLHLDVDSCQGRLNDLLGFAARVNSRRAFLFLSKVLGKHYPARPVDMEAIQCSLADQVPWMTGPVLFIGMAETATGLGQGVFEAWLKAHPGAEALYLQTTRYRIDGAQSFVFEEAHSHAPRIFLHLPTDPFKRSLFEAARHAVLVDDELSTGNTFVNLIHALHGLMPSLTGVHLATIADFMGEARRAALSQRLGLPCSVGAPLRGSWRFEANGATAKLTVAQCPEGQEVRLVDGGHGRLGRSSRFHIPPSLVETLIQERVAGPTLALGTGEFMHPAFVLGRALELGGADVRVQATTRSPILSWGAVTRGLSVPDPYGEGVPNYLYNVHPGQYARVLICHETAPGPALFDLACTVGGRLIHFRPNDDAKEIPVR